MKNNKFKYIYKINQHRFFIISIALMLGSWQVPALVDLYKRSANDFAAIETYCGNVAGFSSRGGGYKKSSRQYIDIIINDNHKGVFLKYGRKCTSTNNICINTQPENISFTTWDLQFDVLNSSAVDIGAPICISTTPDNSKNISSTIIQVTVAGEPLLNSKQRKKRYLEPPTKWLLHGMFWLSILAIIYSGYKIIKTTRSSK